MNALEHYRASLEARTAEAEAAQEAQAQERQKAAPVKGPGEPNETMEGEKAGEELSIESAFSEENEQTKPNGVACGIGVLGSR